MAKPFAQYKDLPEIVGKRTYNQKVYALGGNRQRYRIHIRHIHYKDPQGKLQDINTALSFESSKHIWKQDKASYHCNLPEYADGVFEFYNAFEGANHSIKAKPVCRHIKGTLIGDQHDGFGHESMLYKDAFGAGIDLRVNAYWAGLRKIIKINNKPADTSKDIHFDFEIELPQGSEVLNKKNQAWNKLSLLDFKGKTLRIGSNNKFSYLRNAWLWDSNTTPDRITLPVDIELYFKNGKTYLRKTIKKEILEKAVYPLYTDHPTNYYSGTGDSDARHYGDGTPNHWDTAHNAATGNGVWTGTPLFLTIINKHHAVMGYKTWIMRAFFPFDTSAIDGEVSAATLNLYVQAIINSQWNDGYDNFNVVQTTQPSTSEVLVADYDLCGDVHNPDVGATAINIDDINTGQYNVWTLTETGIGWIVTDGWTKLGLREGHDIADVMPPASAGDEYCALDGIRTAEYANTGSDPFLDVTVGAPPNPYPIDWLKKKVISGYHCFMNAYLHAKRKGYDPLKLPDGTLF